MQQNVDRTLEGDLLSAYPRLSGVSIRKLRKLLSIISRSAPFTPNFRKLGAMIEVGDERTLKDYFFYLQKGRLIRLLSASGSLSTAMTKPEKILLDNTSLAYGLSTDSSAEIGSIREIFFLCSVAVANKVTASQIGDFEVNDRYLFEIGGRKKNFKQIKDQLDSYLAVDELEIGHGSRIPLWLFGFLY